MKHNPRSDNSGRGTVLAGQRVAITGASAGIGEACARAFATAGANLVLIARRKDRLDSLRSDLETKHDIAVATFELDVRDRDAVAHWASALESEDVVPDILVNNAGLASGLSTLQEGDFEDWDKMIDTNIKGLLNVSRYLLPLLVARDSGHVINIGSVAGHIVYPGGNVYNATKFAVHALNQAMNIDLVGTAVRVSSVDPGATNTEFSRVRFHGDGDKAEAVYDGFEPLAAEDIADAVIYVASRPPHVNIQNMIVMPTAQRSPFVLHRDTSD